MSATENTGWTPNQVVAYNLAMARNRRGWTQQQTAEKLEPHLGTRWSKATYSAAERSIDGERIRQFTADDLYAFSAAFDLPITWFLLPPRPDANGLLTAIRTPHVPEGESPAVLVDRLFRPDGDLRTRVEEQLRLLPPEMLTEMQQHLSAVTLTYAVAMVQAKLGDFEIWRDNLRQLAAVLDQTHEMAADRAIEVLVGDTEDDQS